MKAIKRFVALDFETASRYRHSACQLGIAVVCDGEIIEKKNYLIQPPLNEYEQMNIRVHGIRPEHTASSPTFAEIWNEVKGYFNDYPVVCHNASFDLSVVRKTCEYYGISDLDVKEHHCTYRMTGLSLKAACMENGVEILKHHDALADAVMCANIFMALDGRDIEPVSRGRKRAVPEPTPRLRDPQSAEIFRNKNVIVTGVISYYSRDAVTSLLGNCGAVIKSNISKKLDIVIVGDNPGPSKLEKIKALRESGIEIEIIDEDKFLELMVN